MQKEIEEIYHRHNGVDGYRSMTVYLNRKGYNYSTTTIHKYRNTEMGLHSIVRLQKPGTKPGKPHKIFENKLKQDFHADEPNQKWCTDFTYLFLKNGDVRYNCAIIDLYDRSVVASVTDRHITSDLAILTTAKGVRITARFNNGPDPAQRPGKPVYLKGIHRVLRIRPCDPKHEQGRISIRQCANGEILQHS